MRAARRIRHQYYLPIYKVNLAIKISSHSSSLFLLYFKLNDFLKDKSHLEILKLENT